MNDLIKIRYVNQSLQYSQSSFSRTLLIRKFSIRAGKQRNKICTTHGHLKSVCVSGNSLFGLRTKNFKGFFWKYCVSTKFEVKIKSLFRCFYQMTQLKSFMKAAELEGNAHILVSIIEFSLISVCSVYTTNCFLFCSFNKLSFIFSIWSLYIFGMLRKHRHCSKIFHRRNVG